ncbi:MAG: hypothetical protein AAFX45_02480 [Pseudomonadota bacterium]
MRGPYHRSHTRGIDTPEGLARVPDGFQGDIRTGDLPRIAPSLP